MNPGHPWLRFPGAGHGVATKEPTLAGVIHLFHNVVFEHSWAQFIGLQMNVRVARDANVAVTEIVAVIELAREKQQPCRATMA